MTAIEVRTPPLGDFPAVDVIEVHVKAGDKVAAEDPLVTLETDKATMDVPSPRAGTVIAVALKVGAKVSAGDVVLTLEAADEAAAKPQAAPAPAARRFESRREGVRSTLERAEEIWLAFASEEQRAQ